MNKILVTLFILCAATLCGAAEPAKSAIKAATADAKSDAGKCAEAKRYLDRLEGAWVGKEILVIPSGESVTANSETVYAWKDEKGEKVLTVSGSSHTLSGFKVAHHGAMRLSPAGAIDYKGAVQVGEADARPAEDKPGETVQMFIRGGSFVSITKNAKGETVSFTSMDIIRENGEDIIKGMGFVVVPGEGGVPVKVRTSSVNRRKK